MLEVLFLFRLVVPGNGGVMLLRYGSAHACVLACVLVLLLNALASVLELAVFTANSFMGANPPSKH